MVAEAERIKRVLLSLSHVSLRVSWLAEQLVRWAPERAALALNDLAAQNEAANPEAHEAMLAVAMLLAATEPGDPLREELRREAGEQRLWSLARLLRLAPDPAICAPPFTELAVPDYGAGRELTLGERRSLARRPDRRHFDRLLADPHPMVLRQLLVNPKLTELDVVRICATRPARREALSEIVKMHRWMRQPRVRMAILLNPGAPAEKSVPFVVLCTRRELREVIASADVSVVLRATAHELYERRPPAELSDPAGRATVH